LKYLLLSDLTNLPYSKIDKFLSHDFQGEKLPNIDEAKEIQAVQMRLALGLTSPIEEMHNMGLDVVDVLNSQKKYLEMLKDRGLTMNNLPVTDEQVDDTTNEKDNDND